jgi:ATP-dependent protease HslVU (ClpYQ) peptidase subunit
LYQSAFLLALAGRFAESRALVDRLPAEVRQQSHTLALVALDLAATGDQARVWRSLPWPRTPTSRPTM